jgi:protein arginine N-methyltransferase 5
MLTTPITNSHFHSRVLSLLRSYSQVVSDSSLSPDALPLPLVPALEHLDTPLTPTDTISQLVTFSSSWIDLASPDPVIAYVSRQVFNLEIAYAAFCGVITVVVPGPRLSHGPNGVSRYARAIKEALLTGAYIQLHILMPMDGSNPSEIDEHVNDLSRFARPEYKENGGAGDHSSPVGAWDAWNAMRSVCRYHIRLSLGKNTIICFHHLHLPLCGTVLQSNRYAQSSSKWWRALSTTDPVSSTQPSTPASICGTPVSLVC